jgi:hypothetical protein
MPDFDLLVLGDANPDLIVRGDVIPEFGQAEKLVDGADLVIGGSGAIAACGAARLGLRVAFSGVVGDDVFGRFMLDALAERGVDTTGLVVDPRPVWRPTFPRCSGRPARPGAPPRSTPTGIRRTNGTAPCCHSCHRPIASSPTR